MTATLTMPRLGETMEEGTVSGWLVKVGEAFKRGEPLVEFETDKTAVEYPALGPGRLVEVLVEPGQVVKLGQPIARIDLEGADDWTGAGDASAEEAPREAASAEGRVVIDIAMPRLGETMEEGKVAQWLVSEGEAFARGAPLLELETDKTTAEFPALFSGRLVEILVGPEETVAVGAAIARAEVDAADAPAAREETAEPRPASAEKDRGTADAPQRASGSAAGGALRATPAARRAARRAGIDLHQVRGTGRRGRIELSDVEAGGSGGRLASTSWGPEAGPPVLLVHGFAGDRATFDQLGRGLGRAGLRATAVDLPAHGETAAEAASFDELVAGLSPALDPRRPVHVVAHSLGAAVAAKAAESGGVASLTLIAPAGLGLSIDGEFVHGMAGAASPGTVAHLLRRLSERAAAFSDEIVAEIHASLAQGRLKPLSGAIAPDGRQAVSVHATLAALAERMPVRILVGHRDRIVDWRDALTVSPRIAVHHFPNAGHMPHWDAPAEVAELIAREIDHG